VPYVLGEEEPVKLGTEESRESLEGLAKVDMGAGYSSRDRDLAEDL
jgi:hypothetical protein